MTESEHGLMIDMFATYMVGLRALVTALKSHGLLESDDVDAFVQLVGSEERNDPSVLRTVVDTYQRLAKARGIELQIHGA